MNTASFLKATGIFPVFNLGEEKYEYPEDSLLGSRVKSGSRLTCAGNDTESPQVFDSTNTVQFLQNDWNPADGDTHWQTVVSDGMWVSTDPYLLDFYGATVAGTFAVGNDPWETVSIKSLAGEQFDLRGTQEIQLAAHPVYVTSSPYASVVLRLTMQDGSIWDQPKVLANNVWQRAAFPV